MTPLDQLLHEHACTRLCTDFANLVDARDYDRLLNLFADSAEIDRMGERFVGRQAIGSMFESRPPLLTTRHLCTNIAIEVLSDHQAQGQSYVLFYKALPDSSSALSLPSSAPAAVAEYHDQYILDAGRWKFSRRSIQLIFTS